MPANVIKFGDHPLGFGGEYERTALESIRENLPSHCVVLANPSFPTGASFFYEYDIIILSPIWGVVVEVKTLYSSVNVYEDWLEGINNYRVPGVFSKLESKTKVFRSKLKEQFKWNSAPWLKSHVLVGPENIQVDFKFTKHKENAKLLTLQESLKYYKTLDDQGIQEPYDKLEWEAIKQKLKDFSEKLQPHPRKKNQIGSFHLKRRISINSEIPEYLATDELPCQVDVRLIE